MRRQRGMHRRTRERQEGRLGGRETEIEREGDRKREGERERGKGEGERE